MSSLSASLWKNAWAIIEVRAPRDLVRPSNKHNINRFRLCQSRSESERHCPAVPMCCLLACTLTRPRNLLQTRHSAAMLTKSLIVNVTWSAWGLILGCTLLQSQTILHATKR